MFGVNRYTIHVSCADSIERWTLNDAGSILEYGSRQLETPIEKFFVDQTGDIMVSFEDTFLVLRDRDLQAFNIYRVGSEIPAAATIVQDKEKYLIVCYESCLVKVRNHGNIYSISNAYILIASLSFRIYEVLLAYTPKQECHCSCAGMGDHSI